MKQIITLLFLVVGAVTVTAQTATATIEGGASYPSITQAINNAVDGDVILVDGVFTEPITINKNISLRGTDPTLDVIQAAPAPASDGTGKRVIYITPQVTNAITIENLTIRNGNPSGTEVNGSNGGGININKSKGKITLNNLIIEYNNVQSNGGGVWIGGAVVDFINCTVQNNGSTQGGGIFASSNNDGGVGTGIDSVINIKQSLINSNSAGTNGGGLFINGGPGFGDQYFLDVIIENTTITGNNCNNSGGTMQCIPTEYKMPNPADYPNPIPQSISNTSLTLLHVTTFNNSTASTNKNLSGMTFNNGGTGIYTNFKAYNSLLLNNELVGEKAINFLNCGAVDIVNTIFGGIVNQGGTPGTAAALLADTGKNNTTGKKTSEAGLGATPTLSDEGGPTKVVVIAGGSLPDDYCSVAPGITIPTIDQRGYTREGVNDAGAYEFGGILSAKSIVLNNKFAIYPNPASEVLYFKSLNTITKAEIYDMTGKCIFQTQKVYNNRLDISSLKTGLYTLKVEDDNTNTSTKKLVVSR